MATDNKVRLTRRATIASRWDVLALVQDRGTRISGLRCRDRYS